MNIIYKKAKIWFIFQIYIATLILNVTYGQEQMQNFQLWLREGCSGLPDARATNNATILIPHQDPLTASYRVNGLWTMRSCNAGSCYGTVEVGDGADCVPIIFSASSNRLELQMHGDANQNQGWLYLYPQNHFQGTPKIVTTTEDFTLTVRSYFFTGDHSWKYAPEPVTCLCPTSTVVDNGYGFTYNMSTSFQVTRIAPHCDYPCQ
jgi:hypothetical protein